MFFRKFFLLSLCFIALSFVSRASVFSLTYQNDFISSHNKSLPMIAENIIEKECEESHRVDIDYTPLHDFSYLSQTLHPENLNKGRQFLLSVPAFVASSISERGPPLSAV